MGFQQLGRGTKFAIVGGLLVLVVGALALAIDSPADAVLARIRAIPVPEPSPEAMKDPQIMQRIGMLRKSAMEQRLGMIGELYQIDPDRPELVELLPERWQVMLGTDQVADAEQEINRSLNRSPSKKLRNEAAFYRIVALFRAASKAEATPDGLNQAVEDFTNQYPQDERGAEMMDALAKTIKDPVTQIALIDKMIIKYPNSPMTKIALIEKKRRFATGKPFTIDFTDPFTSKRVDTASLAGKIVVVDFWATWCVPCVASMPHMKSLYEQFKNQGVEFIGVCQDVPREEGGLVKLEKYVKDNHIEWPQYYEGKPSAMEFSLDWGVVTIPAVFVVDADGKVVTAEARNELDALIPELIAKRKARANQ